MERVALPAPITEDVRHRMPGYASSKTFERFVERVRNRNAPPHVDLSLLLDFGIPKGATGPLLSTLKWLGVIDDFGQATHKFALLQTPLEDELKNNFQSLLSTSYVEALDRLNVEQDSRDHIKAYFGRNYSIALAEKMTSFFLYLCERAGIAREAAEKSSVERAPKRRNAASRPEPRTRGAIRQSHELSTSGSQDGEPLGVRPFDQSEFWHQYTRFLESVHVPLANLEAAHKIMEERNTLISNAISKLAEVEQSRSAEESWPDESAEAGR